MMFHSLAVKNTMEKSAFSLAPPLSCPCPGPEAVLRSFSCGSSGFILHTQVLTLLLGIVLYGVVYGTQGSAPHSSLVALELCLMGIHKASCLILFTASCSSFSGMWLVCGTSPGKCFALTFCTHRRFGSCHPRAHSIHLGDEVGRWSHVTATSLLSLPSPTFMFLSLGFRFPF